MPIGVLSSYDLHSGVLLCRGHFNGSEENLSRDQEG